MSMEVQVQELIEKIKNDGIKSAEQKAEEIIAEANRKADAIVREAEEKSKGMVDAAKRDIAKMEVSEKEALSQASRDIIISLQQKLTAIFDEIVEASVQDAMKPGSLENVIVTLVKEWAGKDSYDLTVLLSQQDLDAVEKSLRSQLAAEMKKGMEIKPAAGLKAGFYIGEKDGNAYYNFSAEGIAEVIAEYVNPRLAETVREAAKKG